MYFKFHWGSNITNWKLKLLHKSQTESYDQLYEKGIVWYVPWIQNDLCIRSLFSVAEHVLMNETINHQLYRYIYQLDPTPSMDNRWSLCQCRLYPCSPVSWHPTQACYLSPSNCTFDEHTWLTYWFHDHSRDHQDISVEKSNTQSDTGFLEIWLAIFIDVICWTK